MNHALQHCHIERGLSTACRSRCAGQRRLHVAKATEKPEEGPSTSTATGPQPSLANPADTIVWGGRLPSTRRATIGGLAALGIALGGNLGGVTSWLLSLDGGKLAAQLHADVLVPVLGFKRCVDGSNGYEFQYPAQWLADQTLLYRAAQRAEAARSLDPPALTKQRREVVEPSAAFGPPGSSGEENISVIVAPIFQGFKLESLGTPTAAAQNFLDTIVAPPGSDKQAAIVAAEQRRDSNAVLYYQFEFTVQGPRFNRHNVAVLASQDNLLFTLNAQCPATRWEEDGDKLRQSAASFRLSPSRYQQYPGIL